MSTNSHLKFMAVALCLALALTLGVGCKHKKAEKPITQTPAAAGASLPANPAGDFNPAKDLATVYFDFDKSDLRKDQIDVVNKNIQVIKDKGAKYTKMIQIEGHCDERGTQEYNLALGERRALAVRDYMIKNGIDAGRLTTISYGKERPVDQGHGEASWSKNRRAQFNEASK
jgi:peptidoglycan-associated lipoprotein